MVVNATGLGKDRPGSPLKEPLVMFFAFRADAGHDYKTIKSKGLRKLVVEVGGELEIVDNSNWISQNTRRLIFFRKQEVDGNG